MGSSNIFKVWMLYRGLALGTAAIAIVTVSALAWVYRDALQRPNRAAREDPQRV